MSLLIIMLIAYTSRGAVAVELYAVSCVALACSKDGMVFYVVFIMHQFRENYYNGKR